MLANEYLDAVRRQHGSISERDAMVYYPTACALYAMPRFDAILCGTDRHDRLVRWMFDHPRLVLRYWRLRTHRDRVRARELHQLIAAAKLELEGLET